MNRLRLGHLEIGRIPRVVGSIVSAAALRKASRLKDPPFDIAEIRLDLLGAGARSWPAWCRRIEKAGVPVLVTTRSVSEGGRWEGSEEERLRLYRRAVGCASAVDIEVRSAIFRPVAAAARQAGKRVIGSFHNFNRTPGAAVLRKIIGEARAGGADVVKIATFIRRASDVAVLSRLLAGARKPLCVIGLGPHGVNSRISLACAGSCLAYGYVDRPAAPGQMSCRELRRRLRRECPGVSGPSRRARRA